MTKDKFLQGTPAAESQSAAETNPNNQSTAVLNEDSSTQPAGDPSGCTSKVEPAASPETRQTSPRKVESNRRNAMRSTGPRTVPGKNRSRLNSTKLGLLAKKTLLGPDGLPNDPELSEYYDQLRAEYPGQDPHTTFLLESNLYSYAGYCKAVALETQLAAKDPWSAVSHTPLQRHLAARCKGVNQTFKELQASKAAAGDREEWDRADLPAQDEAGDSASTQSREYPPIDSVECREFEDACSINDPLLSPEAVAARAVGTTDTDPEIGDSCGGPLEEDKVGSERSVIADHEEPVPLDSELSPLVTTADDDQGDADQGSQRGSVQDGDNVTDESVGRRDDLAPAANLEENAIVTPDPNTGIEMTTHPDDDGYPASSMPASDGSCPGHSDSDSNSGFSGGEEANSLAERQGPAGEPVFDADLLAKYAGVLAEETEEEASSI